MNSVLCTECDKWIHKRCSGLQSVACAIDFVCPRCTHRSHIVTVQTDDRTIGPAENDVVEKVVPSVTWEASWTEKVECREQYVLEW